MAEVVHNAVAFGHEKLSTMTAATGFTATELKVNVSTNKPYGTERTVTEVVVTVEVESIRYTTDGTTPTTTATTGIGHLAAAGDVIIIRGYENIANFKAINAVDANGAIIQATFHHS